MLVPENVTPASTANESTSNGVGGTITTGTTQRTDDNQAVENVFAGEAVRKIESFIEAYRTGMVKKSQAVVQISQVLAAESGGSEQLKLDALERYSSTLDGIETRAAESNKHGARLGVASLSHRKGKDESDKRGQRHEESDRNNAGVSRAIDVDDFLDRISKGNEPGVGGNDRNVGRESGDESDPGSDDGTGEQGRSNKNIRKKGKW